MQWSSKSKKAFVQALNIEFLTATGVYTHFQFREAGNCRGKDQIYMLFPSDEQEEYQKYLEQVTAKYKGAMASFENSRFNAKSFPFCISPGRFSSNSKKGMKFKISLDRRDTEVMNNLYNMFVFQLLSFEIDIMSLPFGLCLDEYDKRKGYIAGWAFSENDRCALEKEEIVKSLLRRYNFQITVQRFIDPDLGPNHCVYIHKHGADEAVQRAIKDFPTEILRQYPIQLLILFNVFYHDLSAKKGMSPGCEQLIKETWFKFVHTAKANGNIVSFNYDGDNISLMSDKQVLYEIDKLYEGRATEGTFSNFINLTKKDHTTITASFNFDLHNMNIIMNKVLCDVDSIENAREFAINQRNGTARPIRVMGSSRMPRVANDTVPSSSKQNFLLIPGKLNDSPESSASSNRKNSTKSNKSNDSALGTSPTNPSYCSTSSELHVNAASFDSGHGSNVNLPTKKYKSNKSTPTTSPTHSDVTVIPKNSKASSIGNVADLDNLEQNPNKVKSKFIRNIGRGKSVPSSSRKVSSAVKIERWQSLDNVRVKV